MSRVILFVCVLVIGAAAAQRLLASADRSVASVLRRLGYERVCDTSAFVARDGCSSHKDLFMLKLTLLAARALAEHGRPAVAFVEKHGGGDEAGVVVREAEGDTYVSIVTIPDTYDGAYLQEIVAQTLTGIEYLQD
jgi:creatinine amidohydrolase/Fe(II)-dependent formamide hydrolase-like protein